MPFVCTIYCTINSVPGVDFPPPEFWIEPFLSPSAPAKPVLLLTGARKAVERPRVMHKTFLPNPNATLQHAERNAEISGKVWSCTIEQNQNKTNQTKTTNKQKKMTLGVILPAFSWSFSMEF